ncbi:E3 ubiquitin-protein ligase AMFR-like isoform X1 [Schistocerca gregaria]|uniref:E3 ubiquitin-protein ligase AMFR-like isoform X1 n=1 Tax=Schistocerca gregaria TaxID=7010 RepID=UPI00211EB7D4|nr:E3 ubiquitin-protein ligase AMFR-like isoform X1 [Schistocerca gregaria]
MPVVLLDRLPLPSLRAYTFISLLLVSCSVYYAVQVTSDPKWRANATLASEGTGETPRDTVERTVEEPNLTLFQYLTQLVVFMVQEPLCIWTLINMAYCVLILVGKVIQRLVFGELRVSEQQHIKDKFWNFVFYKFIFVFGVINVQYMDEVVLWCAWFSVLGFLHLLAQLCKDRFEYLSFSPTTPTWSHFRLLALLLGILMLSGVLFIVCILVGFFGSGLNTFAFMVAECIQLTVQTLHTVLRYCLHLYDLRGSGAGTGGSGSAEGFGEARVWERRGPAAYYAQLIFELAALVVDLLHHLHMLLWSNIFLSMASLVICMQLRYLGHEIQRRLKRHRNYLWVLRHMQQNYPMATPEELAENSDNCAICWEKMESARRLPCSHLFHNSCLQSWLEQDTSCPTCRLALSIQGPSDGGSRNQMELVPPDNTPATRRQPNNHFFHFDGSRYVSWLPSFSVEVTHTILMRPDQRPLPAQTSQLDSMALQVQQLFPNMPLPTIVEDLQVTRSVELTVENILDGRLVAPLQPAASQTPAIEPSPPVSAPLHHTFREDDDHPHSSSGMPDIALSGGRFSKSPSERERILRLRKEQLLNTARRRYIERRGGSSASPSAGSSGST